MRLRLLITCLLTLLLFGSAACGTTPTALPGANEWNQDKGFGPTRGLVAPDQSDDFPEWDSAPRLTRSSAAKGGIFDVAYGFYTGHLTQMDGPRCEHRPTCSRYAYLAMQKHGATFGSWMAVDRLMRSNRSSVLRRLPIYKIEEGKIYFLDPVDANDFFL